MVSNKLPYEQKFLYLEDDSWEENFQRWWRMNTLEKELYNKYWNAKEDFYNEDQARKVFTSIYLDDVIKPSVEVH